MYNSPNILAAIVLVFVLKIIKMAKNILGKKISTTNISIAISLHYDFYKQKTQN